MSNHSEPVTIQVTAREEMATRAAIRQNDGFIKVSTIIGNVTREVDGTMVNLGNGFQITYVARKP